MTPIYMWLYALQLPVVQYFILSLIDCSSVSEIGLPTEAKMFVFIIYRREFHYLSLKFRNKSRIYSFIALIHAK